MIEAIDRSRQLIDRDDSGDPFDLKVEFEKAGRMDGRTEGQSGF